MRRYFYTGNALTKKWLETQLNMIRMQDSIYRDALLAALNLQPQKIKEFKNLRQTILNMTMEEQLKYANNYHLQSLYKHFNSLHSNSRGKNMIMRGLESLTRDIVDPDKFPVWDLKRKPNTFYSTWNTIMGKIRYDIGHELIVKNSLIQHPEGGRGVFVQLAKNKQQIQIGDFLGVVPGSVYQSYEAYEKLRLRQLKSYERTPQHLHFASGIVLQLGQFKKFDEVANCQINIQPYMVNPYSLGQFINHPPYGKKANVIFSEVELGNNFFPSYLKNYLPYNSFLPVQNNKKKYKTKVFAIYACQPIKNNEQLYVDYCQNHIYPIQRIPEWMIEPDYQTDSQQQSEYSLNFRKMQYENPSPQYWKIAEEEALKQNEKLYQKYLKTIKYRPNKVLHQDEQVKISTMNLNINKK